jgi:hypothetical protein
VTDKALVMYCAGKMDKPHTLVPIARYDRPAHIAAEADQWPRVWQPVRSWRDGDTLITVPEFERWVTDDNEGSMRYGPLSLPDLRRLFRYRCKLCGFDEQHHTDNHEFDVQAAHEHVLNALADRGAVSVQEFARMFRDQITQTRR